MDSETFVAVCSFDNNTNSKYVGHCKMTESFVVAATGRQTICNIIVAMLPDRNDTLLFQNISTRRIIHNCIALQRIQARNTMSTGALLLVIFVHACALNTAMTFPSARNSWIPRLCRLTCSRCQLYLRHDALCNVQCERGAGVVYMGCLTMLMQSANNRKKERTTKRKRME